MSDSHNEKVQEIIDHIKTYFDKNSHDSIDEDEFLELFEEYTDYVCGEESYEDKLGRLSSRLFQQLEKDGFDVIDKKSHEFYALVEKEDKEMEEAIENINKNHDKMTNILNNLQHTNDQINNVLDHLQNKMNSQSGKQLSNELINEVLLSVITNMLENFEFQNEEKFHKKCKEIEDLISQAQNIINRGHFDDKDKIGYQTSLDQFKNEYIRMKGIYANYQ
ncbi:putative ORFan [Tupanvirus deep ocean]|uniref:ORFan n=2 Tax=Tupanvirus TaxID=2094720 RepID=A0AC62A9V6_9VIRU|nr:putative ORFan [Tupanvirus deep ocean]QKU34566.1 putative ORFan [Tupanvirus deep ocean]